LPDQALQELDRLSGIEGALPQDTMDQLQDVLFRRLADDASEVAAAALNCTALLRVSPKPLLEALCGTLGRVVDALTAPGSQTNLRGLQAIAVKVRSSAASTCDLMVLP
jgi:hypothetical protein